MAKAFSDTIDENNISFGSTSYINNRSDWSTTKGDITYGDTIIMGADSRCIVNSVFRNQKVNYIKISLKIDADNSTISTKNGHAVSCFCNVTYNDNEGVTQNKQWSFYPKYVFEDDYIDDNTVIQLGNNMYLKNIYLEIINKEEVPVKIIGTDLKISVIVDEETINNKLKEPEFIGDIADLVEQSYDFNNNNNNLDNPEYVSKLVDTIASELMKNDKFNKFLDKRSKYLVIPVVDRLPDIKNVPDGYVCRVDALRGVDYREQK